MNIPYNSKAIEKIWSPASTKRLMHQMWQDIAKWQAESGFSEALKKQKVKKQPKSGHEVVDALNEFVAKTGLVNAHAGLTSSDIIDNVRLMQCVESMRVIRKLGNALADLVELKADASPVECLGYTHWQPATKLTMRYRLLAWREPLARAISNSPYVRQKRFGGGTGTGAALAILLGKHLEPMWLNNLGIQGITTIQSSDHHSELAAAQWLAAIAGQVHKIAQDIRFLCHTGELSIEKDKNYRGSSAMPRKQNPIEAEQVCSLARKQPNYVRQVWDALAFNGLERTLDTSAVLRTTLPEMFNNCAYILEKMIDIVNNLQINEKVCARILKANWKAANVELEMARQIKKGKSRFEVYSKLNKK